MMQRRSGTTAAPPGRRRRPAPRWVPKQHGAWAMLVVPWLLGAILRLRAGETASHLLPLLGCWLAGYVAFHAASGWLKAPPGRRPAWVRPLVVSAAVAAAFGLLTLALTGASLAWWVVAFVPLLAPALVLAARRRERSVTGGALTVAAASVMAAVAAHPDPFAWPSAPDAGATLVAVLGSFAYFFGTVWYVKTTIRERGSRAYLAASLAWHGAATLLAAGLASAGVLPVWWAVFFAAATARAAVVPRRVPALTPPQIGLIEIGFCAVLVACFAWW